MWARFASKSYFGSAAVFCSSHYGIPQQRIRAFFVLVDSVFFQFSQEEAEAICEEILSIAIRFKMDKAFN